MPGLKLNSIRVGFVLAAFVSLILSLWFSLRETVVNPDAICYLQSAAEMKLGLHAAMHLCPQAQWPFYSALIYIFAQITHLSYLNSAYCLDAIMTVISVVSFLGIIRYISLKKSVFWLGMLVILLAHEFNAVRQYIIRDHGFWAFYLLSLFFLLHYFRSYQWRYALAWSMSLIVATLFRIEGAIYLLLLPLGALFDLRQTVLLRLKAYFQLNTLTLLGAALLVLGVILQPKLELSRLQEVQYQFLHGVSAIVQHMVELKQSLAQHVLSTDSARDAGIVLFLMFLSWYAFSVMANLAFIYALLVIYAWFKRLLPAEYSSRLVVWAYVIVGVVITSAFLVEHLFLSKRYLIALSLALMIWVPFALDRLIQQWKLSQWPVVVTSLFILATAISGIIDFGYSKKYIHDAGNWLAVNVPHNAMMYSNDYQLMYYSQHYGDSLFTQARDFVDMKTIADGKWKQYDYLALRISKKEFVEKSILLNQINYTLVQVFANKRGDQVRVYRRI